MGIFKTSFRVAIVISALASAMPAIASDAVLCVQKQLNALGFDAGSEDGQFGSQTRQAGERYRQYMTKKYAGWGSSPVSRGNASEWCKQIPNANPKVMKIYKDFIVGPGGSIVQVVQLKVSKKQKSRVPYPVEVKFKVNGRAPVSIKEACFTWNGKSQKCYAIESRNSRKPLRLQLVTARPGTYYLNAAIRYSSNGKSILSNWSSQQIQVQ